MDEILETMLQGLHDNPGEPYCATCWYGEADVAVPFELNEDGDLSCPNCSIVIEVEGVE